VASDSEGTDQGIDALTDQYSSWTAIRSWTRVVLFD